MASCRQLLLSHFYSFGYSFIILLYHLLTRTFISLAFLEPILPRNVICLTWNCRSILSLHGKTRKRRETNLETANEDDICVAITLPRFSSLSSCVVINRNRCRPELVWHAGDIIMHFKKKSFGARCFFCCCCFPMVLRFSFVLLPSTPLENKTKNIFRRYFSYWNVGRITAQRATIDGKFFLFKMSVEIRLLELGNVVKNQ